jgi:uroporphyrinogen-III decarboxylase
MDRKRILKLAEQGLRMPIGTDLVLHEEADPMAVRLDPEAFSHVLEKTARKYKTPFAVSLMDLQLEKKWMLGALGIPEAEASVFHFETAPTAEQIAAVKAAAAGPLPPLMAANAAAIGKLAKRCPDLAACGMSIGPFSLMTKLLADPITPVYLAGQGMTAADEPEVELVERCLELALLVIERSVKEQAKAGAQFIFLAEPAANRVYISPHQMAAGSDVFDRYVMEPNRKVRKWIAQSGADLLFHCCGELTDEMICKFGDLDPALLSLGSSRPLWDIAHLVPQKTVLFGNLPSKKFSSDRDLSDEDVRRMTRELIEKMKAIGRPFILGSECDILSVKGCECAIHRKVDAFLKA